MTAPAGPTPPLHRRFNEAKALEQIRNRYEHFRTHFGKQVEALQKSAAFRALAQKYYAEGYKDWHILSAVYNLRLNWEMRRLKLDIRDGMRNRETMKLVAEIIEYSVELPVRIVGAEEELTSMFGIGDATCLGTYGFEPRRPDMHPDVVQKFLRERMRHFELDLPHEPLFGEVSSEWPSDNETASLTT